jgi:glycerol kinase
MPSFVASIHQSTTCTRCMIFNSKGESLALAREEHRQIYLQSGWVEHLPLEIWKRTQDVIRAALSRANIEPDDLAAVGISNQRETIIVWNKKTGEPYFNAIVWRDTRTKEICDRLISSGCEEYIRCSTGLPVATYFSGPKIKWIIDNVDGVKKAAEDGQAIFGNIDTWLIWWLTGGPNGGFHVTDVTNASRTMLMNLHSLDWDIEILKILGIPHQMLPRITSSSDSTAFGTTLQNGPFGGVIPVCGDLGDQQAALVGQACYNPGEVMNTYGTGCFVLLNTGPSAIVSKNGLLTTLAYKLGKQPAHYALEGSIDVAGELVQWFIYNLGIIKKSAEIEHLARSVPDNGGIYIVPAFSGLFAPYWRSDARGVIVGLSRFVNKGHLARAVLESIAFQTREVLDAMEKDSGVTLKSLKVDGEMVANELLMSFQADILGMPVVRPKIAETTALGAAYAAGLAAGFWGSLEELRNNWQENRTWQPHMTTETRQQLYSGWLKAVERTFNWIE